MTREQSARLLNILAIACGVWVLLTGWIWSYYANLFISLPADIIGFLLWNAARKRNPDVLNKVTLWILIAGIIIAVAALFIYL